MRDSFIFYRDWMDGLKNLEPALKSELLEAIIRYGLDGELPELSGMSNVVFGFIKTQLDRAAYKYEQLCERNRVNGRKGGAPKGNHNAKKTENNPKQPKTTENNQKQPKTTQNNHYDNDNDNDMLGISSTNVSDTPNKGKEKNIKKKTQKEFSPPSAEDVAAYCAERGNGVDAYRFVDFYSSKGWMVGKNKMKDWRAAVRTWERGNSGNERKTKNEMLNDTYRRQAAELAAITERELSGC